MPKIELLLKWYDTNHRDLPWRNTSDPYMVWLSEIILQQTRVVQGLSYYLAFAQHFPTVHHLAKASEDSILKLWQGLGYYSRARNMHHAAKTIVDNYEGIFPNTYDEIHTLKGIGPYTAAAIASIVFNEARPVIDGNVQRVISRWYAIEASVDSSVGKKMISEILETLIYKPQAGKFNQAMMEFGALYCKPQNPHCEACIFRDSCLAFSKGLVSKLPLKSPKIKQRKRHFYYLFIKQKVNGSMFTFVRKRSQKDIWTGLYEFPMVETLKELSMNEILQIQQQNESFADLKPLSISISKKYTHQLTHQRIQAWFIELVCDSVNLSPAQNHLKINLQDLHQYPIPRLIDKYLVDQSSSS